MENNNFQLSCLFPVQIISDNLLVQNIKQVRAERGQTSQKICSNILLLPGREHCIALSLGMTTWRLNPIRWRSENGGGDIPPCCPNPDCPHKISAIVRPAENAAKQTNNKIPAIVLLEKFQVLSQSSWRSEGRGWWSFFRDESPGDRAEKSHSWKHNGILMHESKWAFVWTKCLGDENLCELVVLGPPLLYTD